MNRLGPRHRPLPPSDVDTGFGYVKDGDSCW